MAIITRDDFAGLQCGESLQAYVLIISTPTWLKTVPYDTELEALAALRAYKVTGLTSLFHGSHIHGITDGGIPMARECNEYTYIDSKIIAD